MGTDFRMQWLRIVPFMPFVVLGIAFLVAVLHIVTYW
jgi:hypothetical protein